MPHDHRKITLLQNILYRFQRRIAVADCSVWKICSLERLLEKDRYVDAPHKVRQVEKDDLSLLIACNSNIDVDSFLRLDRHRFRCYAAFSDDRVVAYAWVGTGSVPAEHNCNGHPWTGLPFELTSGYAYLFAAYVYPASRGMRLYHVLVAEIARTLLRENIQQLILTVDASNRSAMSSVDRMGFQSIGSTRFFRFLGIQSASYLLSEAFLPNSIGTYVGDTKSKRAMSSSLH